MSLELLNTSAPRGVRPGSTGFCTVGMTARVTPALEERLTLLSGYRWLVPPGEKGADNNPVAFAHWRMMVGGRTLSILSRVCDAGFDYSRRSNRFAHHVVLESAEQVEAGPTWVMMQPGVMRTSWVGEPMVFEEGPDIPSGPNPPRTSLAWAKAAGDAGWAGVLAEAFASDPSQVSCLIYPPGLEVLPLIDEAVALLPAALRWQVTFSTYFTDLPAGMMCAWRCCAAGTRAAADAPRQASSGVLIDLTKPLPPAPDGPYASVARGETGAITGAMEEHPRRANPPSPSNHSSTLHLFDLDEPSDADVEAGRPIIASDAMQTETDSLLPLLARDDEAEGPDSRDPESSGPTPSVPQADSIELAPSGRYPGTDADSDGHKEPSSPAQPQVSVPGSPESFRRRPHPLFWTLAVAWPLIVAGGAIWYIHRLESFSQPNSRPVTVVTPDPTAPAIPTPPTSVVDAGSSVSLPVHNATTQQLESAQKSLDEREKMIAQLRANLAEIKDELAAAKIRAEAGQASQADLEKLKADYAQVQTQLAAATRPAPSAPVDHTIELFRDEVELWAGDGNGPPDSLLLESYKPPEGLLMERSPARIIFKNIATAAADGAKPVPVQLAVIKIDGGRVMLEWITANRAQVSSAVRAWLQLSRLTVQRQGAVVAAVRFVPPRNAAINVDREAPSALLPEVRWKDAVRHVGLAVPDGLPPGWAAREKDPRTVTISNVRVPDAAFDVQLSVTDAGDVQAQTTYANTYYKVRDICNDPLPIARSKAAVERSTQQIKDLADVTGTKAKDPARQHDLDTARHDLEAAAAAQRDAEAVHRAAEGALAELGGLPALSLHVVNRENGLVLCTLRIKRGQ